MQKDVSKYDMFCNLIFKNPDLFVYISQVLVFPVCVYIFDKSNNCVYIYK